MNEKFGRDDRRREKTRRRIEHFEPRLFSHICQMSEIPRYQIIDFMKRGVSDVHRIGDKFSVYNSARNITFG
jgi:hypothetical protein